jgi:hypothetical protein
MKSVYKKKVIQNANISKQVFKFGEIKKKSVKCRVWIDLILNVENEEFNKKYRF